jgi:hypothetical protein
MTAKKYVQGVGQSPKKRRGHTAPRAPGTDLSQLGWLRVCHVLYLLNVGHSTFYAGLRPSKADGTTRYPKPDGWDGKRPYWLCATIKRFLEKRSDVQSSAPGPNIATSSGAGHV